MAWLRLWALSLTMRVPGVVYVYCIVTFSWRSQTYMKTAARFVILLVLTQCSALLAQPAPVATPASEPAAIVGFRDAATELRLEQKFLAVPDPRLAEEHLRTLTAAPHIAGSPEDRVTAEYVARRFREAGLEVRIDEYKVWMNRPKEILVEVTAPAGVYMRGPTREHVSDDPFQNDPRIVTPFSGSSPSGEVEAEVVYANYGRPEDLKTLAELGIDVKGKILVIRYGQNFRGVKAFVAQEHDAAGVILYSDPIDDGYFRGDMYPKGPYRPESAVQRGSIGYMFEYPGDPTTPGIASTPDLPDAQRIAPEKAASQPRVPTTPLSCIDVAPILKNLGGPESPREWQGALPFTYHVGPGPVKVHMKLVQDYRLWPIWNVIGVIRGSEYPDEWVVAGNHRDAWVFGAVDPNSGTAAMLETVHGMSELLKSGWRPRRTIVFASWDAEEEGLIGSTEFAEQYAPQLQHAAAYFNMDVAVAGPNFGASSVPSLKDFLRDVTRAVPSPQGGSVYDVWRAGAEGRRSNAPPPKGEAPVGDLGSGSDYTAFLQHLGVPATDIGSGGPYGVYHSAFDDFTWFKKFGDPTFAYEQQMARVFGLEVLRMAQTDALPYDYENYGREIRSYLEKAQKRITDAAWKEPPDFTAALAAADRLTQAGTRLNALERKPAGADLTRLNNALTSAERAFLTVGLPHRPWFRHAIFAPGEYTGYAAVVIPGVSEAIDRGDAKVAAEQLEIVTRALVKAATTLESVSGQ